MLHEQLLPAVVNYVNQLHLKEYLGIAEPLDVIFLAQGEYNLNYLLVSAKYKYVLRINTASQMQLENQIAYEFRALELLSRSGVTPKAYYLDDSKQLIPYGLLIMEYLPGEPLDYRSDLQRAADTFARIHKLQFGESELEFLVREQSPLSALYTEAVNLLQPYLECPQADGTIKTMLERALKKADDKRKQEQYLRQKPWLAVINTEVNSHNFIVNMDKDTCHLIDWEKPILGDPAQDLSMFVIKTTTLWKQNYRLSQDEETVFLRRYLSDQPITDVVRTLPYRVELFKYFNYLRAISWCAMAWTEYIKPGRTLVNNDTFEKIKYYLTEEFIKEIF